MRQYNPAQNYAIYFVEHERNLTKPSKQKNKLRAQMILYVLSKAKDNGYAFGQKWHHDMAPFVLVSNVTPPTAEALNPKSCPKMKIPTEESQLHDRLTTPTSLKSSESFSN